MCKAAQVLDVTRHDALHVVVEPGVAAPTGAGQRLRVAAGADRLEVLLAGQSARSALQRLLVTGEEAVDEVLPVSGKLALAQPVEHDCLRAAGQALLGAGEL